MVITLNINIIYTLFINSTDFHPSSTRLGNGTRGVCNGCNAHRLPTRYSHCHVCKAGKQGRQSKQTGTDGALVFADRKYQCLLGNFPSRIAGNAENSPIRQGVSPSAHPVRAVSPSKLHRYFDEMMNANSKYMIIRHIDIHQIFINGYLPMNGKCALPYSFSFGEYSDEKLMSIYAANIQMFICHFIKSSDFHPSSTLPGNGAGLISTCSSRSSRFRFQRQR